MRALLLKRASLFAYPGGVARFDPSHPAAVRTRFSGVSAGANFVSLLSGKQGTITNVPTRTIDGRIGPAVNIGAGGVTDRLTFSGQYVQSGAAFTVGAIVVVPTTSSQNCIFADSSAGNGFQFYFGGLASNDLAVQQWGGLSSNNHASLVAGRPYFVATTKDANRAYFVWTDLSNGQIFSMDDSGNAATASVPNGTYTIGNWGSGQQNIPLGSPIAAVMYSDKLTSMAALVAWAQDPWAFWYPRTLDLSMMLKAPAGGGIVYTLAGAVGTYSQSGKSATPSSGRGLTAVQGTFLQTGPTTPLNRGIRITASPGAFLVTAPSVGLNRGIKMAAAQGAFVVSNLSVVLGRSRIMSAVNGTYGLTGPAVSNPIKLSIVTTSGLFVMTGLQAVLVDTPVNGPISIHFSPFIANTGSLTSK